VALGDRVQFAALIGGRLLGCLNAQLNCHPLGDLLALSFGLVRSKNPTTITTPDMIGANEDWRRELK
jgi:hypothetical protein